MTQQKLMADRIPYEDSVALEKDDGLVRFYYDYFSCHLDDIYHMILSKVPDQDCASELRQETILKALEKKDQLKEKGKSKSWLRRIANNVILDYFRDQQKWVSTEGEEAVFVEEEFSTGDMTFELACRNCDAKTLMGVLQRLPKKQRDIICLHHISDLTFSEIARIMGESPNTIASWYYRSCKKMKRWLEEEGSFSKNE